MLAKGPRLFPAAISVLAACGLLSLLGSLGAGCTFHVDPADLGAIPAGPDARRADLLVPPDMAQPDPGMNGPNRPAALSYDVPVAGAETVAVTLYGPSGDGKELLRGPFPLLLFSTDLPPSHPDKYKGYAERLASHGFLVAVQLPRSTDLHRQYRDDSKKLLDWLLAPTGAGAERVGGRADKDRIGALGHGLGGKISLLLAAADTRVKAVLGIDPIDWADQTPMDPLSALSEIGKIRLPVPIGLLGGMRGSDICAPMDRNYAALYRRAPSPAFAIGFTAAGHLDFLDCQGLPDLCKDPLCRDINAPLGTFPLAQKYAAAYFLWTLGGVTSARDYLLGQRFQADAKGGDVTGMSR